MRIHSPTSCVALRHGVALLAFLPSAQEDVGWASVAVVDDLHGHDARNVLLTAPGKVPFVGNGDFAVLLADLGTSCAITPGAASVVAFAAAPGRLLVPGWGCGPGAPGELLLDPASLAVLSTAEWGRPGRPAIHPLPIPPWPQLSGRTVHLQALIADARGRAGFVLTNRLDLVIGPPEGSSRGATSVQGALGAPDPTLLPVATPAQRPATAAYDALGVPSLPAGASYFDPTTGVTVHKLTSASFPTSGFRWGHAYSEGGDEVSLPYDGRTRAVHVYTSNGSHWLVDFAPVVGVENPRALTGAMAPWGELGLSFSNDPATPWFVYISTQAGSAIRRFDLRTMSEAPGDGWPVTGETGAGWLHQSELNGFFVWLRGANGDTVVGYEPRTGTKKTYTNPDLNEPRIDRAGRFVGISMNQPQNALLVWDWQQDTIAWSAGGTVPFAHVASLKRRWLGVDWNMSYPPEFTRFVSEVPGAVTHVGGPAVSSLVHGNGNWIQSPADLDDQWAVFLHYGSLRPAAEYWLAPGGMVLMTANGERRLLAHAYNTSGNYTFYSFAKLSPDGLYVLFTSDMNVSGRSDLFLAELPRGPSLPDSATPWPRR